jgi:hypothetical protein
MNEPSEIPEDLHDSIDAYISGSIDERRLKDLEERLRADEEIRRYFVRYCRLHTDLELEARARQAGAHALKTIDRAEPAGTPVFGPWRGWLRWGFGLAAAAILVGVGLWIAWKMDQVRQDKISPREEMAWLINAQNCQWAQNMAPAGDMQAGKVLRLERGLAEIRFQKGARIVMEGPASLEIISANSARLQRGKLSAKVPESAKGFQIITPQGKVVDLGTEFAMAVEEDGSADVYVFAGKVEAYADAKKSAPVRCLSLQENQGARIDVRGVSLKPAQHEPESRPFVRDIPVIVPRVFMLDFLRPITGTLVDARGQGTGLTHRLPGTGQKFKSTDENLILNSTAGQLELTTTNSDLNTQFKLDRGEYLGIMLSDLGFTGAENFALTVVVPNIPALQRVGQFGLYAGVRSDRNIRGGLLSRKEPEQYRQFLVQNQAGIDAPPHYVGLTTPGDDLRLTLRREEKQFSLTVENLTTGNSTILTMPQPAYLEAQRDIYVGFFGANTQSEIRRTLILKEFKATVWTVRP